MAPLTWRNVDSPNFSGANEMWKTAAALMNAGFDRARQGLTDFRDITTDEQSAALMQQVSAAGNDPTKIAQITAGANPAYLSPAALQFANNQPGVLLDREGKQLANTGEGIQNTIRGQTVRANDYNFDRTQIDNQRADQRYAQMPEATAAMTTLRSQIANGQLTPEQSAAAQQEFVSKYGQTLGITDAQQVGAFMSGNLTAQGAQQDANIKSLTYAAGLDEMVKKQDAKGITTNVLGMVGNDPDQAIRAIKQFGNIDPETKVAALAQIETLRTAMPTKTAADTVLESGTLFGDVKRPSITLPKDYQPVIMNNTGKRNLPLNSNLNAALSNVLPGLGLTAVVTSGGQVTKDEAARGLGDRTGSERHDHGGAADVKFRTTDGTILSWDKPADIPLLQSAVKGLKEAGLTGFGAAEDYMGSTTTHVGYGDPAVWGTKGGKPYQALLDAYNGATTKVADAKGPTVESAAAQDAAPQYQAAMDAISNNQPYNAPINSEKVQINNPDGTVSTEKTFTTEIGGAWFNIPSIVNGKQLPEQEALAQFQAGTNPAVGVFQNKREAEDAAQARSDNIGKMLEGAVTEKDAAATATTQQNNADLTTTLTQPAVDTATTTNSTQAVTATAPVNDPTKEIKVNDRWTIPAVDPTGSQATQDWQASQRSSAVNGVLESIKTGLAVDQGAGPAASFAGSTWDYFMESPDTAKANASARDGAKSALTFYQSDTAKKYFQDNPQALVDANADPVKFAQNFGQTATEKAAVDASKAATTQTPTTTAQTPEALTAARTRDLNAAESVEQAFAAVKGTQSIDAANDRFPGLRKAITEAKGNEETAAVVANRLTGKDGTLAAYTNQEVTAAIQQISDEVGVKPSVAAALLEEKGNYSKGYLGGWLMGAGKGYELNIQEMKDLYATYQSGANAKPGVANLVNAEMSKYQATQVTNLEKEVQATQEALKAAIADPNTPPEKVMDYQRRLSQLPDIVKARLANILAAGNTDANIRKRTAN